MIAYKEALQLVKSNCTPGAVIFAPLHTAQGCYLAEDVTSPVDHPIFNNAAMDGYAFRHADVREHQVFNIAGEIPAGQISEKQTGQGEAWRIFTGAAVPADCDTVIMQEHTTASEEGIAFDNEKVRQGMHVRLRGEQIKMGEVALKKGHLLDAAAIGFLGSLGIQKVAVHEKPSISIAVTGSEFAQSASDLSKGKIYESNSSMLGAAVERFGYKANLHKVEDDPTVMASLFSELAEKNEVLLFTGGVSVGKYDYTKSTLEAIGFEEVFHKVNQKPGKPLLCMKRGHQIAFGLPGNPRAALLCFYVYAVPALRIIAGASAPFLPALRLPLTHDLKKASDRVHFMAAHLGAKGITVPGGQNSHLLKSMSGTNGLLIFDDDRPSIPEGTMVDILMLPTL